MQPPPPFPGGTDFLGSRRESEFHYLLNEAICSSMKLSSFVPLLFLQWNPDFSNPRFPELHDVSNLVFLGFASFKLYDFTPDFSNPQFLEIPENLNKFWLPRDKLTLENSNLRKFRSYIHAFNQIDASG